MRITKNIYLVLFNPFTRCRNANLTVLLPGIAFLNCKW